MKFLLIQLALITLFFTSCSHEYVKPENYQNPVVQISTDLGTMEFELYEEKVPNSVSHFLSLVEAGFYQDMFFHAVVKGALIQGGCPNTKPGAQGKIGTGQVDYTIEEETDATLKHDQRGVLSLARGYEKGSTGCQFVIMLDKMPVMDGNHTMIGRIIKGQEVLDLIESVGSRSGEVKREVEFSVKLLRKNEVDYQFKKFEK